MVSKVSGAVLEIGADLVSLVGSVKGDYLTELAKDADVVG